MSVEKVARRYADALFSESIANNRLEQSFADLSTLANAISASKDFSNFLKSPIIDVAKKATIVKEIFSGKLQEDTLRFLDIIINNKREAYLTSIISNFFQKYNDLKGIAEVNLTVAAELDDATQQKIENYIKSKSGRANVKINQSIDASILGGFIVDFGDKILDSSVINKLGKVKKQLLS